MAARRATDHHFGIATSELDLVELERRARALNAGKPLPLREWTGLAEAWRIAQALRDSGGNRSAAARDLCIGRRTLYSKMEKLGLEPTWCVSGAHRSTPTFANGHTADD